MKNQKGTNLKICTKRLFNNIQLFTCRLSNSSVKRNSWVLLGTADVAIVAKTLSRTPLEIFFEVHALELN